MAVGRDDEIGYLSGAFNDMAGQLLAQHRKLIDANETLEQRVKKRTSELQEAVAKLDTIARTDPLTELANRRAFHEDIGARFAQCRISRTDLAVVMMDLDGFKQINDTFGHERGDKLLGTLADTIRDLQQAGSLAARLGGDEFVLVMSDTNAPAAADLAGKIRERFETRSGELFGNATPPPTMSMSLGVASYRQSKPESADALLAQADQALYRAKGAGKSRVEIFEPEAVPVASSEGASQQPSDRPNDLHHWRPDRHDPLSPKGQGQGT